VESWIRRKALAEWRGYDPGPEKPLRLTRAGDAAAALLKKFCGADQIREAEIQRAWTELVGDFLASHSRPVRLRDGLLVIQVLQPTVHYELDRVWRPRILQKLRERFGPGSVREIRFRLG